MAPVHTLISPDLDAKAFVAVVPGYFTVSDNCLLVDLKKQMLVTQLQRSEQCFEQLEGLASAIRLEGMAERIRATATGQSQELPILMTPYFRNYFHMTLECAASLRLLDESHKAVGVLPAMIQKPFQRELLDRCLGGRPIIAVTDTQIHCDPVLFFSRFSTKNVDFVRARMGKFASPGKDIVYIDRGGPSATRQQSDGRPGSLVGMVVETQALRTLFERIGARRVNFGSGELSVSEQIALLNGAGTVIAAHGAALTNAIYLNPPANVIELAIPGWESRAYYEEICTHIGLNYRRMICNDLDEQGRMIVDTEALGALVGEMNSRR